MECLQIDQWKERIEFTEHFRIIYFVSSDQSLYFFNNIPTYFKALSPSKSSKPVITINEPITVYNRFLSKQKWHAIFIF